MMMVMLVKTIIYSNKRMIHMILPVYWHYRISF